MRTVNSLKKILRNECIMPFNVFVKHLSRRARMQVANKDGGNWIWAVFSLIASQQQQQQNKMLMYVLNVYTYLRKKNGQDHFITFCSTRGLNTIWPTFISPLRLIVEHNYHIQQTQKLAFEKPSWGHWVHLKVNKLYCAFSPLTSSQSY